MDDKIEQIGLVHDADVLILGSGAAGCGAALAAKQAGASVLLVDKGKLESSGCLGGGNDHFLAVLNSGPPEDTTQAALDFYRSPVNGFTPAMVKKWVDLMPKMVDFLEGIGVEFIRNDDGSYLRTVGFGQPGAWFINIRHGHFIKRRLGKKIRSMGVQVADNIMVTKILVSEGRAAGALGYNVLDGSFHIFRAKSVIMALGNSTNRATTNSTGNPFNTWHSPFNTGSQFVLAYEAGARVINLDLKQQATLIPKGFGCAGMNGINSSGAHEQNALGERFMGRYHPLMENGPRREQIMGTYLERLAGSGPPFYMDMRHCDRDVLEHLQNVLMPGDKATFLDYADQRGIDFPTRKMEVELSEIEFSGMIETDEQFETGLPGLFNACVFYYFSGSICGGYLAGQAAAGSLGDGAPAPVDPAEAAIERDRVLRPLTIEDGLDHHRFESAIRQVMNYYMGYVRNGPGMETALERLALIAEHQDRLSASNYHELMRANEALHLLTACQLSTLATLQRKESGRAIYHRADYPKIDPAYARVLALWRENGEPRFDLV